MNSPAKLFIKNLNHQESMRAMSEILTLDNPEHAIADMAMAKSIAEALHKQYPGHLWMVNADNGNNIATVQLGGISGKFGFNIHLDKITAGMELIMRAGGEILERYNLSRGRRIDDDIGILKRDFAGRVAHEQ